MEPYFPFLTLNELVGAEDITIEKVRNLDIHLEINIVTSKLKSQVLSTENFDPISEIMFTQKTDPTNKKEHQFGKYCNYCKTSKHSVLNCLRKQCKDKERTRNTCSRLTSPAKCFIQNFRAYQNQIHPNKQPSSSPVIYYSRRNYDSIIRRNLVQIQENHNLHIDSVILPHYQTRLNNVEILAGDVVIVMRFQS